MLKEHNYRPKEQVLNKAAECLEEKWARREAPYQMDSNEYLDRQAATESNARSYPRRFPLAIAKAEGMFLEDTDGRVFMDCLSGAGTLALGHNHPSILQAIRNCIDQKLPLHTLDLTTPVKDAFVAKIMSVLPTQLQGKCKIQFCSPSGSDGIEAAIKLVKTATGRRGIFSFNGGYHGMSHGALAMTGAKSPKQAIHNLMKDVTFLPYPYHYRCPFGIGGEKAEEVSLHYIENMLKDTHSGVNLPAAFILEVVQGEGGSIPASDHWVRGIREITARYEIPLIIDEVQSGIGRTGTMFSFEASGITPDVVVISKAVGGSLPLSIMIYQEDLDQWKPGAHAGTFRGNQMAMATGTAVIDFIQENNLIDNAAKVGKYLLTKLKKLQEKYPVVGEVRGRGLMIGVEIVDTTAKPDPLGSYPTNSALASRIQQECFREGLIVETGGRADCVLRLLPPLTLTAEQAKTIVGIFDRTIARALKA